MVRMEIKGAEINAERFKRNVDSKLVFIELYCDFIFM